MGCIDLNAADEPRKDAPAPVCRDLWHACAGPVVALPRRGSALVYLPQAHLAAAGGGGDAPVGLPPHVACRVVDVELCADPATDEVYARLALVAEGEVFEKNMGGGRFEGEDDMEDVDGERKSRMLHMFCKTLTASDTSTHGGFSVPRRAAEDCFPPLDYQQIRPSQELVAKDLHGAKWRFRHIYRGQPRRHLLTTGWSSFVNKKKLVSGDAVLFLRGDDGELRLGVRRAIQLKNEALLKAFNSNSSKIHTLSAVVNSLKHRSVFHICYNPRAAASEFIVPYWKFLKSLNRPFCIGMRFKIQYGSEDVNERRSGMITGINEVDPIRWTGSKWKSLLVRWEDGIDCNSQNRLSPWEIEIVGGSVSIAQSLSASSSKRTKLCPQGNLDVPTLYGNGRPDSVGADKLPRVLQGQELMGSGTHRVTCPPQPGGATEFRRSDGAGFLTDTRSCMLSGPASRLPPQSSYFAYQPVGFGESVRGIRAVQLHVHLVRHEWRVIICRSGYPLSLATPPPAEAASPSQLCLASKSNEEAGNGSQPNPLGIRKAPGDGAAKLGSDGRKVARTSCMLFGFSLTEKMLPTEEDCAKEGSHEADCQNPRMLDLFGYNRATPSALHALCAAPLGI
ncbi:Auxin response factor 3 [Hordeum vulgare]|nr:Auxin response factor 3 [Hordeum vulgare]